MSGSASLGLEQAVLGHTLGFAPMTAPTQVFVALCLAAPAAAPAEGTPGTEVSGLGYYRTPAVFALATSPANMAANVAVVEFPIALAAWGTVGYFELWDAQVGGNRLYWGQLIDHTSGVPATLTVASGDIVRFSPGTLGVQAAAGVGGVSLAPWLPVAGGTMTGPLTLAGNATQPLDAVPLQQLNAATAGGPFLPLAGGTITPGNLNIGGFTLASPRVIALLSTAGQTQDLAFYAGTALTWRLRRDSVAIANNTGANFRIEAFNDAGAYVGPLLQGARSSGPTGQGGPYLSALAPYIQTVPMATVPGGVVGNNQAFPTTGADVQPTTTLGTDPLSTTSGSAVVNITWTGCGAAGGVFAVGFGECYVNLLGATATGGITPTGWLKGTRVDNDTFSVTWTANATSTATGGGSAVTVRPNFVTLANKEYAVMTAGTAGFPVQYERLFVANPAFYKTGGGSQYQQEFRQVYGPPDPSGNNSWGIIGTELDLINRGPDTGYSPNLYGVNNPSIGYWSGAFGLAIPGFATGGGTPQNWNTVYSVLSVGPTGNYVGYSVQPNALVGAARDSVTSHGGVGFVAFGAYTAVNANGMATTSGASTVTFTAVLGMSSQVNGGLVYIPTVTTLNGVTVGGGPYSMAGVTATSFNVTGTGTASVTGVGGAAQSVYFANLVPYAPMEFRGSYKHGISTTEFRSEDGSIIYTQPGNGIVWDDGTGTASVNSSVVSPGVMNISLATAGGVNVGRNTATLSFVAINGAAGNARRLLLQTAAANRWALMALQNAEGGSNAGSDFVIQAFDDSGASLGFPLTITRSNSLATFAGSVRMNSTVGFNNTAPVAKPSVSGAKGSNAALASLITALASYGLITDSTTA